MVPVLSTRAWAKIAAVSPDEALKVAPVPLSLCTSGKVKPVRKWDKVEGVVGWFDIRDIPPGGTNRPFSGSEGGVAGDRTEMIFAEGQVRFNRTVLSGSGEMWHCR